MSQEYESVVRGTVVTEHGSRRAAIGIRDGRIAAIEPIDAVMVGHVEYVLAEEIGRAHV